MDPINNTLIVLAGPTGVGKTDLSVELAEHLGSEIISCDSRQFYREMSIGTATPEACYLERIKHHFVGFLSVTDYYSASLFENDVLSLLPSLFEKNRYVLMTGGSMLYIDAVCNGIDDIPDTDPSEREKYQQLYEKEGLEGLRMALRLLDPEHYSRVDLRNPRRIMRALEISGTTGKPYSSFLTAGRRERDFRILKVYLRRDREELHHRINKRVDKMIASGLEEEARLLIGYRKLNALNTVGYREMFSYFDGEISFEAAVELIKRNTRRYARKQMTWWSKDHEITWFDASEKADIFGWIDNSLKEQP